MKNIIAISIVFLFTFSHTLAADVQINVGRVQSSPSYSAPAGYEEKGFIGSIISQIFDPVGKILSEYILAFQNILNTDNTIPVWNATTKTFNVGSITDTGTNVGIGISTPSTTFHVNGEGRFDGGIEIDGNQVISPSGNGIATYSLNPNRYGFFKVWNGSGQEGAYFGYGNGGDRVDFALRGNATKLAITGGNVGIGVNNPEVKLDVEGKIKMRNQTEESDNDNVVATKGYVDTAIANINFSGAFSIEDFTLLKEGIHTVTECRDAGGVPVKGDGVNGFTQDGQSFCKFTRSSCPSGWTQNGNWMKTLEGPEYTVEYHCSGTFCSTSNWKTGRCPSCGWSESCSKSVVVEANSCTNWRCGTAYNNKETSTCIVDKIGCY